MNYSNMNQEVNDQSQSKGDALETGFDKAFPESDELPFVRKIQKLLYQVSKKGLFNILLVVIAIIVSLFWGIIMGILQFVLIWLVLPGSKLVQMVYGPIASVAGFLLNLIFGPCLSNVASKGSVVNITDSESPQKELIGGDIV